VKLILNVNEEMSKFSANKLNPIYLCSSSRSSEANKVQNMKKELAIRK
jgi:hypothetical protein